MILLSWNESKQPRLHNDLRSNFYRHLPILNFTVSTEYPRSHGVFIAPWLNYTNFSHSLKILLKISLFNLKNNYVAHYLKLLLRDRKG